jgi:hypothetical protein
MSLILMAAQAYADELTVPPKPESRKLTVTFNGEKLNAYTMMFDSRSAQQKLKDKTLSKLGGDAIIFFQGHGQRPKDCYKFTEALGMQSLSGIVVIPVCDTPYGKDPAWRGDKGKMAVLMAVTRYLLNEQGISVDGYAPITDMEILVDGKPIIKKPDNIRTKLCSVGWSHGGILAREFAHYYPGAVEGLSTVCSAGYKKWSGTCHLMARFSWEGMRIGTLTFSRYAGDALGAGWGITCGITGDAARSVTDSISSCQASKLGRSCRNINDCTSYLDDTNAKVDTVKNIVVIFGRNDTCMDAKEYGIKNLDKPEVMEITGFWKTYYPSNVENGSGLSFWILPGTHIGPITNFDAYAEAVLVGLKQIDPEKGQSFPENIKRPSN